MTLAPPPSPPSPPAQEFSFEDGDFRRIAALALAEFGLSLSEAKKPLVYSRLARRLRSRGIASFGAYIDMLEAGSDEAEKVQLLSALTTNVTQFFREAHHFDLLRQELLPDLLERARQGGRVRLWSAGCSTGQEPYSLAMTLLDLEPKAAAFDIKILATDIDPAVMERARAGQYRSDELTGLTPDHLRRWTRPVPPDAAEIGPGPRSLVTFNTLNLIGPWPVRGPFDIILCRNVAIYFDKPTQARLWSGFEAVLATGGALLIGHSERLPDTMLGRFSTIGVTAYRHTGTTPKAPLREGAL